MNIQNMKCPSCGNPLPTDIQANQLIKCDACGNTMYMSGEEIDDTTKAAAAATPSPQIYSVAELLTALDEGDKRVQVQIAAISALKRIGGDQALDGLVKALGSPSGQVRQEAIRALGEIGQELATPHLLNVLKDDDWSVRRVAAVSLGQIGDKQASTDLLAALSDPSVAVRVAAARSLERIGDQSIIPELKRLLGQQLDNDTRQAVEHTLNKLEPPGMEGTHAKPEHHPSKKTVDRKTRNIVNIIFWMGFLVSCIMFAGLFCIFSNTDLMAKFFLGSARFSWHQGDLETAIEDYDKAIKYNPDLLASYLELCQIYDELDEPEQVIDYCTQAIERDPTSAKAYQLRGYAYYKVSQFQAALEDYDAAIELDPAYAVPYYNRALLYDDQGDEEAALDNYIRYLEVVEDKPEEEANIAHASERIETLGGELPD